MPLIPTQQPVTPSIIGRTYGYNRSPYDPRDIQFAATSPKLRLTALPPALNWKQFLGSVTDQLTVGCCTGEAAHNMREFLTRKWVRPPNPVELSPMFIYQNAVILDGQKPARDPGATVRSAVQVLQKYGAAPETDEPFDPKAVGTMPSKTAYTDALTYRAGVYKGLYSLMDSKQCIAQGFVFNIGFAVYSSFESDAFAADGIMPMPQPGEQNLGGHAVCVFGYDDTFMFPGTNLQGALLCRNSWGIGWGASGNFYMPYAYLTTGFVSEAWMIHLGPMWT
jgi:C1A family cysteine protease